MSLALYNSCRAENEGVIQRGPRFIRSPVVDGRIEGPCTREHAAGATLAVGNIVILASTGKWVKADANSVAGLYNGRLGFVMEAGGDGDFITVALRGAIVYVSALTFVVGRPEYLSETAGAFTETAPTSGTSAVIRIGVGVHVDKLELEFLMLGALTGA